MMSDEYITRHEHDEFMKRMEDHNSRQDARLKSIERNVSNISRLTVSVEKMAVSMESMSKEQVKQGNRLEVLEGRDGEKWRTVASYMVTAVIGLCLGIIADMVIVLH